MNRILAAISLCALVAACSTAQLAATGTRAALSPETVATLAGICRQGQPLLPLAAHPAMPESIRDIGQFVGAYCGALLAGTVPPTTDGNTANWLAHNLATLRALLGR